MSSSKTPKAPKKRVPIYVPLDLYADAERYMDLRGLPSFNAMVNMLLHEKLRGMDDKATIKAMQAPVIAPRPGPDATAQEMDEYRASLPTEKARVAYYDSLTVDERKTLDDYVMAEWQAGRIVATPAKE